MNSGSVPRRVRLGMVGGGPGAFIGAVHRFAARLDDEFELVAVAPSSDAGRARAGGEELRVASDRIYADYREMARCEAARPDGIDVVAVVVPNHLHCDVARVFLDAGLHVICDKPLATSLEQGKMLLALARQKHCLFGVTYNYSGYPLIRAARELVAEGAVGDIRSVQVEYLQDWLAEPLEKSGQRQAVWRTDPALAGSAGCLADIGTHAFHLAEFVTGQLPVQLSAELVSFVPGRRLDDHVQVQLRYSSGARGILCASQVATGEENGLRLRIYGTRGSLRWQQESPNELWFTELGMPAKRLTRGMSGLPPLAAQATRLPAGHPEGFIEAFAQIYRDFATDLRTYQAGAGGTQSQVSGLAAGIHGLAFVEAVLSSHRRNGEWVNLDANQHSA